MGCPFRWQRMGLEERERREDLDRREKERTEVGVRPMGTEADGRGVT